MRALAFAVSAACGSPCATAKAVAISAMHIIDNNRVVIRVVAKRLLLLPTAFCFLLTAFCLLPTAYCSLVEAPGIDPGSKSQRRRTLHAYLLLFPLPVTRAGFAWL